MADAIWKLCGLIVAGCLLAAALGGLEALVEWWGGGFRTSPRKNQERREN